MNQLLGSVIFALCFGSFCLTVSIAQETTDENDLKNVIEDIQSGNPDYDDMEPELKFAAREQQKQVEDIMSSLGSIESITFEEVDQGLDIYIVYFENGRTLWKIARSSSGRIAALWFNVF